MGIRSLLINDQNISCLRTVVSRWRSITILAIVYVTIPSTLAAQAAAAPLETGKAIYDFYCYQCHGYSGDAETLASTYLEPPPRNFTASDPSRLTRETMLDAVSNGRPGTGMVSFTRVLNDAQIAAVVDFVRDTFMTEKPRKQPYHSVENGWPEHARYQAAFPFATGEIPLDTPAEDLTSEQIEGKRLFMNACISCHDRAHVLDEGPIWEPHAVSYPRKHYSHKESKVDGFTGATPYVLHERAPSFNDPDPTIKRGEALFQKNCAFCHAADGTGRNWIGSFLQPRPRDLTGLGVAGITAAQLKHTIRDGIPGTSMPAWKHVLDEQQIDAVIAYVRRIFMARPASSNTHQKETSASSRPPIWTREIQ